MNEASCNVVIIQHDTELQGDAEKDDLGKESQSGDEVSEKVEIRLEKKLISKGEEFTVLIR